MVNEEATLHIFDVLGKEVYVQKLENTEGSVFVKNNLVSGVYSIQIKGKGRWSVPLKVVKTQ